MQRYLTKSRFKLALECPTKLFYTAKKNIYADLKLEDDFLKSLAEGGFQVGELAKLYYPGGVMVDTLDYETSLTLTNELLAQEKIIIFEAAFLYDNLFIRADIVVKDGNNIELIEVKAKSYKPGEDNFLNTKGFVKPDWQPYLYDAAFQKYVLAKSYPKFNVRAFLLLADKSQQASIDGLNQKFYISQKDGRYKIRVNGASDLNSLGNRILVKVNVENEVNLIYQNKDVASPEFKSFEERIKHYSDNYNTDSIIYNGLDAKCGSCEFNVPDAANGLLSGFHECWKTQAKFDDNDFKKPSILKLWDFRKKSEYIKAQKYFLTQLSLEDLESKTKAKKESNGLSRIERQEMQINMAKDDTLGFYFDKEGLKFEMTKWLFPLHFIDFETSAVAIPFNKGRRPYEQIAFQFSHHVVHKDGRIVHQGEWIDPLRGVFPNFSFVRELKKDLEKDNGTIFRYAAHENSILNAIFKQLQDSSEPDRDELCNWITTITKSSSSSTEKWEGTRNMVDLKDLVVKYYYDPSTNGSNSIKAVLPAILNSSDYIKQRYSKPIYGTEVTSKNYKDHTWVTFDESGATVNPYDLLPAIHEGYSNESLDEFVTDEEMGISDGGAAMMAYARMQFTEMSDEEHKRISAALLRYCELDTFAMVMIWEAWNNWCYKD